MNQNLRQNSKQNIKQKIILILLVLLFTAFRSTGNADAIKPIPFVYRAFESYGLADTSGKIILEPEYQEIIEITPNECAEDEKLFIVKPYSPSEDMQSFYALYDDLGNRLTNNQYTGMAWSYNYLITSENGQYGILDTSGKEIIKASYSEITLLSATKAVVSTSETHDELLLLDIEAATTLPLTDIASVEPTNEGYAIAISSNGKFGIIDANAAWITNPLYDSIDYLGNGLYCAEQNGMFGVVFESGGYVVPPQYDAIEADDAGEILLAHGPGSAITIFDGDTLTPIYYEKRVQNAVLIGHGHVQLYQSDQSYIVNPNGTVLFTLPQDASANMVDSTHIIVSYFERDPYSSELRTISGEIITEYPEIYSILLPDKRIMGLIVSKHKTRTNSAGQTYILYNTRREGLLTIDGTQILPLEYDSLWPVADDRLWAVRGTNFGLIDSQGNWLLKFNEFTRLVD